MKQFFILIFTIISLLNISLSSFAKTQGVFTNTGIGGRSSVFGESFVAIADDASAIHWNPAGISKLANRYNATASRINLFSGFTGISDINYNFFSLVLSEHPWGGGISLDWLGTDEIIKSDTMGNVESLHSSYAEYKISPSISGQLWKLGSVGIAGNYFRVQTETPSNDFGITLGWLSHRWIVKAGEKYECWLRFGVAARNAFDTIDSPTRRYTIASAFGGGFEKWGMFNIATAYSRGVSKNASKWAGIEYGWNEWKPQYGVDFNIYGGFEYYPNTNVKFWKAGGGIGSGSWLLNYSFERHSFLENTHRVALNLRWSKNETIISMRELQEGREVDTGNRFETTDDIVIRIDVLDDVQIESVETAQPKLVCFEKIDAKQVDVVVKNTYGQSDISIGDFTYTESPSIDKIFPEFSAPEGGIFATITGKWFFDDAKVTFDTVPAVVTKSSATTLEVVVPPLETDEPKKVDVVVENPNGQSSKPFRGFVYTKAPEINKISPVNGIPKGGTRVTITGKWFMEDVAVTFGGNPVEAVKWLSFTTLEVITPSLVVEHPTPVEVIIKNAYGQSDKRTNGFIYTEAPHIEKISPISGTPNGGTQITISGKWFIDGSSVKIGKAEATEVKVKSDSEITAITPPGSLGKKDVIVINPYSQAGTLPGGFEYRKGPVIQRIHPVVGPLTGNTQLTINGSGFVEDATVVIGEKEARPVTYVSEGQLIAITPPSAEAGLKNVIVINPDEQQSNPGKFNYVDFPEKIRIYNFPNPFQTGQNTTFRYKGGNGKKVEIKIFNLAGELVQSLSKEGGETINWDGKDLEKDNVPPGLYPYIYLLNGKFEQRQLLQVIK